MVFGYARVSTVEQRLDLQIDALKEYGCDEIYEEKISGKREDRPQLNELLGKLRAGDVLVIWKLDRLGRTVKQLLKLAEEFEKKHISLVSIRDNFDTSTAVGKFCFHMFCALAQMERDIIAERTVAGLEAAKKKGNIGGRKPKSVKNVEKALEMYKSGKYTIEEIIAETGLAKSTIYRYIKNSAQEGSIIPKEPNKRNRGRKAKDTENIELAVMLFNTNVCSISKITEITGLSKPTIYKYVKEQKDHKEQSADNEGKKGNL